MGRRAQITWIREKGELCRFRMFDSISCPDSCMGARKCHAFHFRIVIIHRDVVVYFWSDKKNIWEEFFEVRTPAVGKTEIMRGEIIYSAYPLYLCTYSFHISVCKKQRRNKNLCLHLFLLMKFRTFQNWTQSLVSFQSAQQILIGWSMSGVF